VARASCPVELGPDPIAPPGAPACCEAIALVVDGDAAEGAGEACGADACGVVGGFCCRVFGAIVLVRVLVESVEDRAPELLQERQGL